MSSHTVMPDLQFIYSSKVRAAEPTQRVAHCWDHGSRSRSQA